MNSWIPIYLDRVKVKSNTNSEKGCYKYLEAQKGTAYTRPCTITAFPARWKRWYELGKLHRLIWTGSQICQWLTQSDPNRANFNQPAKHSSSVRSRHSARHSTAVEQVYLTTSKYLLQNKNFIPVQRAELAIYLLATFQPTAILSTPHQLDQSRLYSQFGFQIQEAH